MRSMNVLTMLLAGGVGERLFPLTANRCKPAVPFGGNFRIIDFTLMNCLLSDLRQVHILGQYHIQSLHSHQVSRWNFLSREFGEYIEMVPPKLRAATTHYQGTADAIYRNLDLLDRARPDVVLILSGDHVYRADYRRFLETHVQRDADVTVLTGKIPIQHASSFGVISFQADGRISRFIEKPIDASPYALDGHCQINLGVYCFETEFLVQQLVADARRQSAHDFGKNILPDCVERGRVFACPLDVISPDGKPYWRDVGTIDSYYEANMDLLRNPAPFELTDPRWSTGSRFFEWVPARYVTTALIGGRPSSGRNLIGSGAEIEQAQIVDSIVSRQVRIGRDAELDGCILFPGCSIGAGAKLRRAIVEEGVHVPSGTTIGFGGDDQHFVTSASGVVVVSSRPFFPDARSTDDRVPAISRLSHLTDRIVLEKLSAARR